MIVNGYTIEADADLAGANLAGANLENANLAGANLACARGIIELPVGDPRGYRAFWVFPRAPTPAHRGIVYAGCRVFTFAEAWAHPWTYPTRYRMALRLLRRELRDVYGVRVRT